MKTSITTGLAAAILLSACHHREPEQYEDVRPVWVATVSHSKGTVGAAYSGEIRARHEHKAGFRVGGKITERLVDVGDKVAAGQVLMRLDPQDAALNLAAYSAQADSAESRLAKDSADLTRAEELFRKKFISQAELDQNRMLVRQSSAQLRSATAQRAMAANQRGYTELRAERAGVVTAIYAEAGQTVGVSQAVLAISEAGEREIVVSVPESRVAELKPGRAMQVTAWTKPDKVYAARLRELAPDTDSVTRTYIARATILEPDDNLRLGMTATLNLSDVEGEAAIRLPLTAVTDQGKPTVWVVDPKTERVRQRPVKLLAVEDDTALISGGLQDGERVVTAGVHMLHTDQKVRVAARSQP
jgi:multidrug efflux system membrane fusion protein